MSDKESSEKDIPMMCVNGEMMPIIQDIPSIRDNPNLTKYEQAEELMKIGIYDELYALLLSHDQTYRRFYRKYITPDEDPDLNHLRIFFSNVKMVMKHKEVILHRVSFYGFEYILPYTERFLFKKTCRMPMKTMCLYAVKRKEKKEIILESDHDIQIRLAWNRFFCFLKRCHKFDRLHTFEVDLQRVRLCLDYI